MTIEITQMPWVPVLVNGKGPYSFGIDTGYLGFCLSSHVVAELHLAESPDGRVSLGSLAVCDLTFRDFEITVRDNSAISKLANRRVDGLLGMGFLKYFQTTLDYPASSLTLVPLQQLIGRWPPPTPGTSCVRISYPNRYVVVPVRINESAPHGFLLDTGAGTCVVSDELARELKLPREGSALAHGSVDAKQCYGSQARSLCVGNRKVADLPVSVMACAHVSEYAGTRIDGYLGYNFLKDTSITVNVLDLTLCISD